MAKEKTVIVIRRKLYGTLIYKIYYNRKYVKMKENNRLGSWMISGMKLSDRHSRQKWAKEWL